MWIDMGDNGKVNDGSDWFQPMSSGDGEQFMATKPYKGAIVEPTNHPPVNNSAPSVRYNLEHVYGYKCNDSRQNLYYGKQWDQVVYPAAALGIIHQISTNVQTFFGGGMVESKAKNVSSTQNAHTDDILCLHISKDYNYVATGQVGASPVAFIWDMSGNKVGRYELPKGSRGITAINMSHDNKYVAMADLHDNHNVFVFDVSAGNMVYTDKGGSNKIFDIAFDQKDSYQICSSGQKHVCFWDPVA